MERSPGTARGRLLCGHAHSGHRAGRRVFHAVRLAPAQWIGRSSPYPLKRSRSTRIRRSGSRRSCRVGVVGQAGRDLPRHSRGVAPFRVGTVSGSSRRVRSSNSSGCWRRSPTWSRRWGVVAGAGEHSGTVATRRHRLPGHLRQSRDTRGADRRWTGVLRHPGRQGPDPPAAAHHRQLLLPVDPDGRWRDAAVVPGFGLRGLTMCWPTCWPGGCVPRRTSRTAVKFRGAPGFRNGIAVPEGDLHDFAAGRLDAAAISLWLRACLALHWGGVTHTWPMPARTPCRYHTGPAATVRRRDPGQPTRRLDAGTGVTPRYGHPTHRRPTGVRARRRGTAVAPGRLRATPLPDRFKSTVDGVAIAAALVPRVRYPQRILRRNLATASDQRDPRTHRGDAMTTSEPYSRRICDR